MSMETVRVTPGILPPTMRTTPNSPMVWAKDRTMPEIRPAEDSGAITRTNVRSGDAPSVADAAISLESTEENDEANGCTAKGRLYRIDPITRPQNVKARVWPVSEIHQRPSGLRGPSATRT